MKDKLVELIDSVAVMRLSEVRELADHLIANGVTLQENISTLRKNYEAAENFICSMCGNCTVTEHENGLTTFERHCAKIVGYPKCGKFVAKDNNVPSKKPVLGYIRSISSTVCDGYTQVLIDFEWDGCHYPIVSKVSHADIVGAGYEKKRRWIPVDEAKPELIPNTAGTAYSDAVNCLTSGRKVITAIWDGADFIGDAEFWDAENEIITHWTPVLLPLPEEDG